MIKKCLFPAAGYGTRFLPATKAMPKEMLPVVNKPLIQYGVEEALDAGLNEISIVTGRGKRALEDHFDISYELENQIKGTDKEKYLVGIRKLLDECSFSYTRQTEMKGLGHAILTGRPLIGDEPFAVVWRMTCASTWKATAYSPRWSSCTRSTAARSSPFKKSIRKKPTSTA
jgi:UTP--glucose-1-phosphate uridylyltransferase